MFRSTWQILMGVFSLLIVGLSTIVHSIMLIILSPVKLLLVGKSAKQRVRAVMARIGESWIGVNNLLLSMHSTHWDIQLPDTLNRNGCFLVMSNHQSWVDILVLQKCFNRRLPLLRFFLKKELIWVPFLGIDWWALDFPFMHRASREEIEKRPELKGADLESARSACEKFSEVPVSMMTFVEGTRFSENKRRSINSPYRNLLIPKSGGVGVVLYALGDRLDSCIDVTIAYPGRDPDQASPTFWQLLSGQVKTIIVRAQDLDCPAQLLGVNFREDIKAREELQDWLGGVWQIKDELLDGLSGTATKSP